MEQNRLRSPVVWTSVISQIITIMMSIGLIDSQMSEVTQTIVTGILQVLIILGVLNNPTDITNF